jgi:hypothetical protein
VHKCDNNNNNNNNTASFGIKVNKKRLITDTRTLLKTRQTAAKEGK